MQNNSDHLAGGAGGGVRGASVSASPMWEIGAVAIGYVGTVASWRRPTADYSMGRPPMLVIQSCAGTDEGVHEPAASVTIASREGLIALRSAIDEALGKGGAA